MSSETDRTEMRAVAAVLIVLALGSVVVGVHCQVRSAEVVRACIEAGHEPERCEDLGVR